MLVTGENEDTLSNNYDDGDNEIEEEASKTLEVPILQNSKITNLKNVVEIKNNTSVLKTHFKAEISLKINFFC